MHELGITRNLVAIVSEQAQGRRIRRVWLEIGDRTALLPDAVRFCFDVVSKGTPLEGATLDILELAAGRHCKTCGSPRPDDDGLPCGDCGSLETRLCNGEELNIRAMEVEPCV